MSRTPFLVSHHPPSQYDRCLRIGPWWFCARCLGLYPLLFALLAAQAVLRVPASLPGDALIALLLPVPAFVDWARGRFDPRTGTNLWRVVTGALLAVGLARTLYLHMREPLHVLAVVQLGLLALAAAVVELLARRRRVDPAGRPRVETVDDGDSRL